MFRYTGLLSCNHPVDDMTALKTNNKEFGDVYSRSILNVKIYLLTLFQYFDHSYINKHDLI